MDGFSSGSANSAVATVKKLLSIGVYSALTIACVVGFVRRGWSLIRGNGRARGEEGREVGLVEEEKKQEGVKIR